MLDKKITIQELQEKKKRGEKITMLTAYDYPIASMVDEAGIDMILVGDSLGMVVLGYKDTLSVSMDDMIRHSQAVKRATKRALIVGDMPYKSFDTPKDAVKNAKRFIEEAGCDAVKLENQEESSFDSAAAIIKAGIAVEGHLGLTPQSVEKLGGFKVQGRTPEAAQKIIDNAKRLEKMGCFSIVLECVPAELGKMITKSLSIPTIGIGAGADCDGQVLVIHDIIGLFERFTPKFVKKYAILAPVIKDAVRQYIKEVKEGKFPSADHIFK
ncbi:MAG: 3-methyl-2-oxobutanoate hydroxymethyltransferase [Candidatus Omnitrophica bacterium CG07_land_8_20_14_0_80_42_15]|uniref:3-methyl-2-oxobutanoate hydroxymethyltransferase n=1 Tax=Candidatus Aquitaenariimonas noxiae TaxID=1974741 RepID=A0A2J0KU97_9BACT|nr:MAG: 3-methyl-2-oxobutanoate hydroxymethyltransferase [Candidatus Omnitrophica bacterium CG07_land_8_20_14_0_80_42_15]